MNPIVHFEIHASDMDKLQKFYEQVFGWQFQAMGEKFGDYRIIMTGAAKMGEPVTDATRGINGGMTKRLGDAPTATQTSMNGFVNIVAVKDVDAIYAAAIAAGGAEAMAPYDYPNVGRLAYIKDPEYNVFGIIAPVQMTAPAA